MKPIHCLETLNIVQLPSQQKPKLNLLEKFNATREKI
jgi:hypothetical protein